MPKKAVKKKAASKKKKPSAPPAPLTGKQKSQLRALAHPLKAVVQIGHQGVTEGVITALSAALERHELIKLKVSGESELDATEVSGQIAKATRSQVAQIIGRTIVLYKRRDQSPKIVLQRTKPKAPARAAAPVAAAQEEGNYDDDGDDLDDEDDDADDDDEADDDEELG